MSWTNATATITQLRTQLVACVAWTPGQDAIHYPSYDFATPVTTSIAVLAESSQKRRYWASGAGGLISGRLTVTLHSTALDVGQLEELARTLGQQLLAQSTGFLFQDFETGLSTEPKPQMDQQVVSIDLHLDYGVNPP
jgi:hypothetical protein